MARRSESEGWAYVRYGEIRASMSTFPDGEERRTPSFATKVIATCRRNSMALQPWLHDLTLRNHAPGVFRGGSVLPAVMPGDLGLAQPEKPGRVVVEDVALLLRTEERCLVDGAYRGIDETGPHHLVGAEHDPVS